MITTLEKLIVSPERAKIGRPTTETVHHRQSEHNSHELIKQCHARVVSLEAKVMLQSNIIQRLSLENRVLTRDLNLLSRL
jgi:hypothetical protein